MKKYRYVITLTKNVETKTPEGKIKMLPDIKKIESQWYDTKKQCAQLLELMREQIEDYKVIANFESEYKTEEAAA